jgi:hypothetical protein
MSKPKHRRCQACGVVTSRYSHTQNAGAFSVSVWVRDAVNGEFLRVNGTQVYCAAHIPKD